VALCGWFMAADILKDSWNVALCGGFKAADILKGYLTLNMTAL
jgi:hypothetical protein